MSALESIRKRPALVIGVLGVALLLFIITGFGSDFMNLIKDHDTVVTVDGTKIKYYDLQQRTSELRDDMQRRNPGQQANIDDNAIMAQALEQLINEELFNKSMDKLGVTVTDQEMQNLLFGENALPYATQMANQYGFETTEDFYRASQVRSAESASIAAAWNKFENDIRKMYSQEKYMRQLGALAVNNLEARAYYDDNNNTSHVKYVKVDYNTIGDDQVAVEDADIQALYNQEKERYAINNEQRYVDYILVRTAPSTEDYMDAQREVEQAIADLRETEGTDAVYSNYNFKTTTSKGTRDSFREPLRSKLDNLVEETVVLVNTTPSAYNIAKLLDHTVAPDSVVIDVALLDANADDLTAVLAALNQGVPSDSIGEAVLMVNNDIPVSLTADAISAFASDFTEAPVGEYYIPENHQSLFTALSGQQAPNVTMAIKVVRYSAPVELFEVAQIAREVAPSDRTLTDLRDNLLNYLANHGDLESFKSGGEGEYSVLNTTVDGSMLQILGLSQSAPAARWIMDAKKGQISNIFSDKEQSYLLAVALDDIYNKYVPVTNPDVRSDLENRVRTQKKGEKLVADLTGKATNLEGYADYTKLPIDSVDVVYGQNYIRGFVPGDAVLAANVAAATLGKVVGPVATKNSAVVFVVTSTDNNNRPYDYSTDSNAFNNAMGSTPVMRNFDKVLRGGKKINYSIQRFTGN